MRQVRSVVFLVACLGLAHGTAVLEPTSGAYFGTSIDFQSTNVQSYIAQTGISPVIYNVFVSLPLNSTMTSYMASTVPEIAAVKAIVLLTIEPDQGLSQVTAAAVETLATYITQYQEAGASVMIRYAHEMNGNWYVWGQQPVEYIASFQLVTTILRNSTCGVAMVWAPNSAGGYPWTSAFTAGTALSPQPKAGTADFEAMDTNGDGSITSADDPYLPFYPGDAYVDWVGMSSFHFGGSAYPYTTNAQAAPYAFTSTFTGTGNTNFYSRFCNDTVHNKPMVITETSAEYDTQNPNGQTNFQIKQNWWEQALNVQGTTSIGLDLAVNFPKIKAVMWFDEEKVEVQAGGAVVDWRFSGNQQILSGFSTYIQQPAQSTGKTYWLQLSDFTSGGYAVTCSNSTTSSTSSKASTTSAVTTATTTYSSKVPDSAPATSPSKVTTTGNTTTATSTNYTSPLQLASQGRRFI